MRKRRSQDEILELLQQFNNSGLTIKAFCTEQSLHPITFSKWRSRYKNNSKSAAFATFQIDDSISNHPALFAEIKGIRIYQPVGASFLKELL